jgi:hypothetical protein
MRGVRGRLAAMSTAGALLVGALALPPGSVAVASASAVRPDTYIQPPEKGTPLPLDSLAVGTPVSTQFERDGIVFSGQSPYISRDPAYFFGQVLAGGVQHQGTLVGTFVKPGTQDPGTVDYFSFTVGPILQPGEVQVTVYNSQGQQLGVLTPQAGEDENYGYAISTFPGAASFSVSTVNSVPWGWDITDIRLGSVDTTYVAMGDSYSSGEGTYIFPWSQAQGTQCDTGPFAWPSLLASGSSLTMNQDTLVACQGERASQLGQTENGEATSELGQLTNLVSDTGPPDLLTLTIGGNDLGFANILQTCFLGGTSVCLKAADALDNVVTEGGGGLIAGLTQAYEKVADAGGRDGDPGPHVVVVGYPNLFPPGSLGTSVGSVLNCPWLRDNTSPWLVSPETGILLDVIADAQSSLNDDMAQAADDAGVQFVDIAGSLSGHELCTSFPFINPLSLIGGIEGNRNMGHPNLLGQLSIANAVGQQLGLISSSGANRADRPRAALPSIKPRRVHGPLHVTGRFHPGLRPGDTGPLSFAGGPLPDGTTGADYVGYLIATGGNGAGTWSITNGSLPPGLTLDPDSGTITGTPTASGDDTFTAQVSDSSNPPQTASAPVTIDVEAPSTLTVGSATPAAATEGQPYTYQLPVTGGLGSVSWAVTSGSLPAGLQLDAATGQITGTPAGPAGASAFSVQATDSSSPAQVATSSESITVDAASDPLTVTTTSLPSIQAGQDYGAQLTSTGGVAPVFWSVPAGSLPPGLSLDPASGLLTGTPTAAGTYDFTVKMTDSTSPVPQTVTEPLSVTISAAPPLTITTAGAYDGTEGASYSSTFQATGGTGADNWTVSSGSLPAGLTLNAGTGQVTGTPSGTGNSTFDVTVSDAGGDTSTQAYAIDITQVPLTVSTALAPATAGTYYAQNVTPSGGQAPYSWKLVSGTLPTGLTFDSSTGAITGTPQQTGSFPLRVAVTDSSAPSQQVTADVTLTVAARSALTLASVMPAGTVGQLYDTGIGYSGGQAPYTWAVTSGTLPPGLSLDPGTGMVTGGPAKSGTYPVTFQLTDSSPTPQVASASVTFTIKGRPKLAIAPGELPRGLQGESYSAQVPASGGVPPYTSSVSGSLPAGLSLNASLGLISGTPTGHGSSQFTVTVTDSAATPATVTHSYTLPVTQGAPLSIPTTSLASATQAAKYDQALSAEGGTGSYTWSLVKGGGSLPAGLKLSASGDITGLPTGYGNSTFTVQVRDQATPKAEVAKQTLSLDVEAAPPAPPSFTSDTPRTSTTQGASYSYQFQATGNPIPAFSVTSGTLPPGLTLAASGKLSGTPQTPGSYTFEVTAANGQSPDAVTPELHITVNPAPAITS